MHRMMTLSREGRRSSPDAVDFVDRLVVAMTLAHGSVADPTISTVDFDQTSIVKGQAGMGPGSWPAGV